MCWPRRGCLPMPGSPPRDGSRAGGTWAGCCTSRGSFLLLGLTRNTEQGETCLSYLHDPFPFWEGGGDPEARLVCSRPARSPPDSFLWCSLSPVMLFLAALPGSKRPACGARRAGFVGPTSRLLQSPTKAIGQEGATCRLAPLLCGPHSGRLSLLTSRRVRMGQQLSVPKPSLPHGLALQIRWLEGWGPLTSAR